MKKEKVNKIPKQQRKVYVVANKETSNHILQILILSGDACFRMKYLGILQRMAATHAQHFPPVGSNPLGFWLG